jgi:CheY-like chemotaxis protein
VLPSTKKPRGPDIVALRTAFGVLGLGRFAASTSWIIGAPAAQRGSPAPEWIPVPDRDQASRFAGVRVLIIEDETLISLLLEDMLTELGCTVLGSASSVEAAIEMLDRAAPGVVVLDINLAGEKSYAVAEALVERRVPFVFSTGYADGRLDAPWQGRPVLQKPFGQEQLAQALDAALKS